MGARVIRSPRTAKGRCRTVYPVTQIVIPASPVQGPYVPQYFDSPKRAQSSEEPFLDLIPGVELSPAASHQAAASAPMTTAVTNAAFVKKSPITILEEVCVKNYWGLPSYTVNSVTQMPDGYYYQYKVVIPVLRLTFLSAQFSRSSEEARSLAAEVALAQLGLTLEGKQPLLIISHGRRYKWTRYSSQVFFTNEFRGGEGEAGVSRIKGEGVWVHFGAKM